MHEMHSRTEARDLICRLQKSLHPAGSYLKQLMRDVLKDEHHANKTMQEVHRMLFGTEINSPPILMTQTFK